MPRSARSRFVRPLRVLAAAGLLLLLASSGWAQTAAAKIAYVDTERIIRESQLFVVGQEKLNEEFSARNQLLELENARLGDGETLEAYPWLDNLSYPEHVELRDDRYVAALTLNSAQRKFSLAYLARAVTPGEFVLPAVYAEDMYKPWYFGRGAMARLTVH